MKTVVLDANELTRDWLCTGLKYQLIDHMGPSWLELYVPAVAFEEVIANHARAVEKAERDTDEHSKARRRLGLGPVTAEPSVFDYRAYLSERFDERLGITILPWPTVTHEELVARAVSHTPPFNEKGSGYRDALIWADVLSLAADHRDVAFVSSDKIFSGGPEGDLSPTLRADVDAVGGRVELVRDFGSWLIEQLPWPANDLRDAVSTSRDEQFFDYYLKSDFQNELVPSVEDLGFNVPPYDVELVEVTWDGSFDSIEESTGPDGLSLVEYDIGQTVELRAVFDSDPEVHQWRDVERTGLGAWRVEGSIDMVVRVAVLFGGDFAFSVEKLSWRRADGRGGGPGIYRPELDPDQLALFELPVTTDFPRARGSELAGPPH